MMTVYCDLVILSQLFVTLAGFVGAQYKLQCAGEQEEQGGREIK